ncbi:hypothetical protein [Peterkaempfera sp. SMS 1(5)a]|uniref:hypothetical protein n=1 Tax=Peterkaempfera podocarpi TaxID=3232308 RepID=UPI00366D276C
MTASAHGHRPVWQALRPLRPVRVLWSVLLVALLLLLPCTGSANAAAGAAVRAADGPRATAAVAVPAGAPAGHGPAVPPSAGSGPADRSGHRPSADVHQVTGAGDTGSAALCSTYATGGWPGSGCSGGEHCLQDAVLPNAPPQPMIAAPYAALVLHPGPIAEARGPLPGVDRAPDLHLLQVLRT